MSDTENNQNFPKLYLFTEGRLELVGNESTNLVKSIKEE